MKIEEGRGNKRRFRSLGEMETKEAKKKELQRRERERKKERKKEWKERTISGLRRMRERTRFRRKKAAVFGHCHFAALWSALIPLKGVA